MRLLVSAAVSVALLGVAACSSTGPTDREGVQVFDPTLDHAWNNLDAAMAASRAPLQLDSGTSISACDDYLNQAADTEWNANPNNTAALPDYAICDSLRALERARPAPLAEGDWGKSLGSRLDFRSFRSSFHQRTTDDSFTLERLAGQPLQTDRYSATLDSPDWHLNVRLVAMADFNGDGRADGLVWVTDRAKEGSYLSVKALVIDDIAANGPLTAQAAR